MSKFNAQINDLGEVDFAVYNSRISNGRRSGAVIIYALNTVTINKGTYLNIDYPLIKNYFALTFFCLSLLSSDPSIISVTVSVSSPRH